MEEQSKNAMLHSAHSDITLVNQGLIEVLALKLPVLGAIFSDLYCGPRKGKNFKKSQFQVLNDCFTMVLHCYL